MSIRESRKVRYAVVGLGKVAQVAVLPAFEHAKESSSLVALVSDSADKMQVLADRYGAELTGRYEDLEAILVEGRIDAVYLAAPCALHRELTERAARAGAHVLCEKPMAPTEDDAERMIRATREHGVKLMIAYRLHFEHGGLRVLERVRAGEIGDPRVFSSVFCHPLHGSERGDHASGEGALFDLGIYGVNVARAVFRDEPTEVQALRVGAEGAPDEATVALLRFPGGRVAQLTASHAAAYVSELRIVGTKGELRLDPAYDYAAELRAFLTVAGRTTESAVSKRSAVSPELHHFSRCILHGTDPRPPATDGLADVRILEAMVRSAQTGTRVNVAPARPVSDQREPTGGRKGGRTAGPADATPRAR